MKWFTDQREELMNSKAQDLPNFICIGSQRAGTTWLHNCLDEHPEVFVPAEKELHFFDRFYDTGLTSYQSHFTPTQRGAAKTWGELTPNYYQEPQALERIKRDIPEVKIVYILRQPAERAFSQYQLYSQGQFYGMSFEEVIANKEFVTDLSMQGKHLQRLYSLFDRSQVLVLFYDELSQSPETFLKRVLTFLQVDPDFMPSTLNKRINRVVLPDLQAQLAKWKLTWMIELVKASPIAEWVKEVAHKKSDTLGKPAFPDALKGRFDDDITLIEQQLGVNLSHWR